MLIANSDNDLDTTTTVQFNPSRMTPAGATDLLCSLVASREADPSVFGCCKVKRSWLLVALTAEMALANESVFATQIETRRRVRAQTYHATSTSLSTNDYSTERLGFCGTSVNAPMLKRRQKHAKPRVTQQKISQYSV